MASQIFAPGSETEYTTRRIFKTKAFARDAESEGLTDERLVEAVKEVHRGLVDGILGANPVKKRIAVGGKGKRGGLRTILVHKASAHNLFCVYVFAKMDADNITAKQLQELKLLAKTLLDMKEPDIKKAVKAGGLQEVIQDEDEQDKEKDE